ncbi:hypothetical protein GGR53DRAFT_74624 [Hypoxylon sp. FL1150]|nr:hypothetical protein GGR53DRAFT_74624 [Hypoxylon sp. FL1150]
MPATRISACFILLTTSASTGHVMLRSSCQILRFALFCLAKSSGEPIGISIEPAQIGGRQTEIIASMSIPSLYIFYISTRSNHNLNNDY